MMKFSAIYEGHKIDVIYESKLITSRFELHLDEDLKSSVNRKIIKNDELTLQTVYIENEKEIFILVKIKVSLTAIGYPELFINSVSFPLIKN